MNDKVAGMIAFQCAHGMSLFQLKEQMAYAGINHVVTLETIIDLLKWEKITFRGDILHWEIDETGR